MLVWFSEILFRSLQNIIITITIAITLTIPVIIYISKTQNYVPFSLSSQKVSAVLSACVELKMPWTESSDPSPPSAARFQAWFPSHAIFFSLLLA